LYRVSYIVHIQDICV